MIEESGATNHPLRGGKYSFWEGGVRSVAFVSGGYIPTENRGSALNEIVHIADWYATLAALGGVNKHDSLAVSSGLPDVDGLNIWPLLSGQTQTSPRTELPLDPNVLISGEWKLLKGDQVFASWFGPDYPNASSLDLPDKGPIMHCGDVGCLYNVVADPTEHVDVRAELEALAAQIADRLDVLKKDFFENNDKGEDSCPPGIGDQLCACWMASNYYGGFFGPYQEVPGMPPASATSNSEAEKIQLI